MQADIYDATVTTINQAEGPALGAAILAGVGTGVYDSCESATDALISPTTENRPAMENVPIYDEYYGVYRDLYHALKPQYDDVADIVDRVTR